MFRHGAIQALSPLLCTNIDKIRLPALQCFAAISYQNKPISMAIASGRIVYVCVGMGCTWVVFRHGAIQALSPLLCTNIDKIRLPALQCFAAISYQNKPISMAIASGRIVYVCVGMGCAWVVFRHGAIQALSPLLCTNIDKIGLPTLQCFAAISYQNKPISMAIASGRIVYVCIGLCVGVSLGMVGCRAIQAGLALGAKKKGSFGPLKSIK